MDLSAMNGGSMDHNDKELGKGVRDCVSSRYAAAYACWHYL